MGDAAADKGRLGLGGQSVTFTLPSLPGSVNQMETDCIIWTRSRTVLGYGQTYAGKRNGRSRFVYAHRVAWEKANGPIPEGMHVLHRCDNPSCVNPEHLFLGTQADNVRDMVEKGRNASKALGQAKLSASQVGSIRKRLLQDERVGVLAKEFNVNHSNIIAIRKGKSWKRGKAWTDEAWP